MNPNLCCGFKLSCLSNGVCSSNLRIRQLKGLEISNQVEMMRKLKFQQQEVQEDYMRNYVNISAVIALQKFEWLTNINHPAAQTVSSRDLVSPNVWLPRWALPGEVFRPINTWFFSTSEKTIPL